MYVSFNSIIILKKTSQLDFVNKKSINEKKHTHPDLYIIKRVFMFS